MLKKTGVMAAWLLLLSLLFVFCLVVSFFVEGTLVTAFICWAGILVGFVFFRLIYVVINKYVKSGQLHAWLVRFRLTRNESILFAHWQAGKQVLSRLKRRKPSVAWYLVVGENSGKSTLLNSAGHPALDKQQDVGVAPTRSLHWWFFRHSAFLEIATPLLSQQTKWAKPWLRLVKWCRRLSRPAGLMVCLSVEDLRTRNEAELHLQAKRVRALLEPLLKSTGKRLPVTLVLTGIDRLPGMAHWIEKLSPEQRRHPLGMTWHIDPVVDRSNPEWLSPFFKTLYDGMACARLSMLEGTNPDADIAELLRVPERVADLRPQLHTYLSALFEADAYSVPGTLQGIWLTAIREHEQGENPSVEGVFSHDLLNNLLAVPGSSRKMQDYSPVRRRLRTGLIGLSCFCAITAIGMSARQSSALMVSGVSQLSADATLWQLQTNEQRHGRALLVPFSGLLARQHAQLEVHLLAKSSYQFINAHSVYERYREAFSQATPSVQRSLIIELAKTIIHNQRAKAGETLALMSDWQTPEGLRTLHLEPNASVHLRNALERALLQGESGQMLIDAQRQLMKTLIALPRNVDWIFSPQPDIPGVRLSTFWPQLSDKAQLEGIFTARGAEQIEQWLALIQEASGETHRLTFIDRVRERMPELRQQNWLALLLKASRLPLTPLDEKVWRQLQIDLNRQQPPVLRLIHTIGLDLQALPIGQQRPWLVELNRLVRLEKLAGESAQLGLRVAQMDNRLWGRLLTLLGRHPQASRQAFTHEELSLWSGWTDALRVALTAIDRSSHDAQGASALLFSQKNSDEKSVLQPVLAQLASLREKAGNGGNDIGVQAIWSLLNREGRQLIAQVMNQAACQTQDNWQKEVLWPLEQNASRLSSARQRQAARNYLVSFVHRYASSLFARGIWGAEPVRYQGQKMALTPEFMNVVNNVLDPDELLQIPERQQTLLQDEITELQAQQGELEKTRRSLEGRLLTTTVTSKPATLPVAAPLMPTGTRLELFCDDREWVLNSVNLSEQGAFKWQPGHCSRVRLTLLFPGLALEHNYLGDAAWPDFVRDFARGEKAFPVTLFGKKAAPLLAQGTESVIVRYQPDNPQSVGERWAAWAHNRQQLDDAEKLMAEKKASLELPDTRKMRWPGLAELPAQIAQCQ